MHVSMEQASWAYSRTLCLVSVNFVKLAHLFLKTLPANYKRMTHSAVSFDTRVDSSRIIYYATAVSENE